MPLALEQSHISQNDLISVNSIVRISGHSTTHCVKAISRDRKSACITSENDDDFLWCDANSLVYVAQQTDLFHA